MEINIKEIMQGEVICQECNQPTEFIGEGKHIHKIMCPGCAADFTVNFVNKGG